MTNPFNFLNKILFFILVFSSPFVAKSQAQKQDTTIQLDTFRTLQWLADSLAKSIPQKKADGLMHLYPSLGLFIKYSKKVAPELATPSVIGRYGFYRTQLLKKHQKMHKELKKMGYSFNKIEINEIKTDTGLAARNIAYCIIEINYIRNNKHFAISIDGINIENQWFLIDGFKIESLDKKD